MEDGTAVERGETATPISWWSVAICWGILSLGTAFMFPLIAAVPLHLGYCILNRRRRRCDWLWLALAFPVLAGCYLLFFRRPEDSNAVYLLYLVTPMLLVTIALLFLAAITTILAWAGRISRSGEEST